LEPGEYLDAVRRRWPVVVIAILLAAALAWVSAPDGPPQASYKATSIISVRPTSGSTSAVDPISPEIVATLATSKDVATQAKARLGWRGSPESLAAQVETKFEARGNTVSISSTKPDAESAANVADVFTRELLSYLQKRQGEQVQAAVDDVNGSLADLQARSDSLDQRIAAAAGSPVEQGKLKSQKTAIAREMSSALTRLQQFDSLRGPGTARVTLVRDASAVPIAQGVSPPSSPPVRAAIAAGVGLLLGIGLALVLDRLDPTLRTTKQAEAAFGLPVVAEVPLTKSRHHRVDVATEPRSAIAESYRTLRTATRFMSTPGNGRSASPENGQGAASDPHDEASTARPTPVASDNPTTSTGRLIVVTSPGPGEGKTASAVNLAATFAEAGMSTLVVGADLRQPALASYLGISEMPGITDVLSRDAGSSPPRAIRRTSIPNLSVLTGGSAIENPAGMLARGRDLIVQARELAEIVIIDTPPLLVANDAIELILAADAVVLVGRYGRTTGKSAQKAAELLQRLHVQFVGVAMIGPTSFNRALGGYYQRQPRSSRSRKRVAPVHPQIESTQLAPIHPVQGISPRISP
jgi:capsular exopolysaccharide synthesis family protein